ncbi:MAG: amidohydrolase [Gammaproteobacteria bacterium]
MTEPPDLLLLGGRVRTMDPAVPEVSSLAIRNGRISALGSTREVAALARTETTVVDLAGRMVMPGLVDGHCHPTKGAIAELFSCKFPFSATPADIAARLAQALADDPGDGWIIGGRWDSGFFERYELPSPRAWLDRYGEGRAIYLRDDSGHNGWVSSAGLERLGITAATPDPGGGRIVRAADGEPNGLLLEQADVWARSLLPDWSAGQYRAGVREMTRIANGYGITGINDADAAEPLLRAYHDADAAGELSLYVAASISTPYGERDTPLDYAQIESLRDRYASPRVDTRWVKIYQDGVPTEARTAAMLAPYLADPAFPDDFRGMLHVAEPTLTADVTELERRGFTVKLHTAGDRSVRVALNAIEQAHRATGRSDLRHELAHPGFVDEQDLPRFAALNVAADLSPYLWYPAPIMESIVRAVGERGRRYFPVRTLDESGAPLLAGSDWPAAVASMDPWRGIETLVTRRPPGRTDGPALWPEQALSLERALALFTRDGARALRREDETGSLSPGKSADLVVLDRDLFTLPAEAIAETRVVMTVFQGRIAFRADG